MNLPYWKSHKTVQAAKVVEVVPNGDAEGSHTLILEFPDGSTHEQKVSLTYVNKHNPQPGGFFVLYKDGYQSWSPAEAFYEGYTMKSMPDQDRKQGRIVTMVRCTSSSMIAAYGYDDDKEVLLIRFIKGNKLYKYDGVPADVFRGLNQAESVGKFFLTNIRDTYPGVLVTE